MQGVYRNIRLVISVFTLAVFGAVILVIIHSASAQDVVKNQTMKELLETLNTRIEIGDEPFFVGFRFIAPLMDNDEYYWEIPYSPEGEDISRWIGEIGDDYICFNERAGSSGIVRCTPFSNIASISYIENP